MLAIGVQTWGTDVAALRRYWKVADELGYTRITYGDGLGDWTHDGWTMLGALAVLTRRARIGPAVTYAFDASSHHPSWLAKRAVAIDHLSDGRLDLRLAVGAEDDAAARGWSSFGIRYPPAGERIEALEETIQVIRGLWLTDTGFDHHGRRYALADARLGPKPIQHPGPPIWVAAMGPRALAVTARHAVGRRRTSRPRASRRDGSAWVSNSAPRDEASTRSVDPSSWTRSSLRPARRSVRAWLASAPTAASPETILCSIPCSPATVRRSSSESLTTKRPARRI